MIAVTGFARDAKPKADSKKSKVQKSNSKVAAKTKATKVSSVPVAVAPPIKLVRAKKSHADLSGAISESYQGRKEIQKEVQSAAGIEKPNFEPVREAYKVELPSSHVASSGDDASEAKFQAPKRGPASLNTKGLMKEIDESEKEE